MLRSEIEIENFLRKAKKQAALGDDDYQFVVDTLLWVLGSSGGQTAQLLNVAEDDMPRVMPKLTIQFPTQKTYLPATEPSKIPPIPELSEMFGEQIKWLDDPYAQKEYFKLVDAYIMRGAELYGKNPESLKKILDSETLLERVRDFKCDTLRSLYIDANPSLFGLE